MRRFAVAIDLEARICPACGYPLTVQFKEDNLTDTMCTECGRRWTLPTHSRLTRMPQAKQKQKEDRQS